MTLLTVTTYLSFNDGLDGPPCISTPKTFCDSPTPAKFMTGIYGTRDRNALLANAMRDCNRRGWPFHRVEIVVDAPLFGQERQTWEQLEAGCNVLNLFKAKQEIERDLASLLGAASLETAGILDKQTVRRLNQPDNGETMALLFACPRMPKLDVIVWGMAKPNGGYYRVASLRSLSAIPAENIKVFDYAKDRPTPYLDPAMG